MLDLNLWWLSTHWRVYAAGPAACRVFAAACSIRTSVVVITVDHRGRSLVLRFLERNLFHSDSRVFLWQQWPVFPLPLTHLCLLIAHKSERAAVSLVGAANSNWVGTALVSLLREAAGLLITASHLSVRACDRAGHHSTE